MSAGVLERTLPVVPIGLTVNGRAMTARVEPRTHLADVVREEFGLTGTHLGCEHGVCGACTVLVDGEPARSCLAFAAGCDGASVTTIEGLDADEITTELRAAFTREHALQCGYCTPGMLVSARDLVLRLPQVDERRVRLGLSGNLCRCTGYVGIVRAVTSVIRDRRARGIAADAGGIGRRLGPVGARTGSAGGASAGAVETSPSAATDRPTFEAARRFPAVDVPVDFQPANSFDETFSVAFPPEDVFALFGRIEEVASCLPGATITARPSPERVEGAIRVKMGPIAAAFRGAALVTRDEAARSGRIVGAGHDAGGRSSTQGAITYRVVPGETPEGARVELSVGYTLKGALAQFGRPGLVRDLAARITTQFARNIEARLAGEDPPEASRELSPLSLVFGMVRGWVGTWLEGLRRG